jgi:hypothetical protein
MAIIEISAYYIITNNNIIIDTDNGACEDCSGIVIKDGELFNTYVAGNTVVNEIGSVADEFGIAEIGTGWGATTDSVKYGVNDIYGFAVAQQKIAGATRDVILSPALSADIITETFNGVHVWGDLWVSGNAHIPAIQSPKNYLSGLSMSIATGLGTTTNFLNVIGGSCSDVDNSALMLFDNAISKQIINTAGTDYETWIAGDENGGVASACVTHIDTEWLHVFALMNEAGEVDIGADTSATAVNLFADSAVITWGGGTVYFRRIGSIYIKYDVSNYKIRSFSQYGDLFLLSNPNDWSTSYSTSHLQNRTPITVLGAPSDVITIAKLKCTLGIGGTTSYLLLTNYNFTDVVPTATMSHITNSTLDWNEKILDVETTIVSSTPKVYARASNSGVVLLMVCLGYTDLRGKEGY